MALLRQVEHSIIVNAASLWMAISFIIFTIPVIIAIIIRVSEPRRHQSENNRWRSQNPLLEWIQSLPILMEAIRNDCCPRCQIYINPRLGNLKAKLAENVWRIDGARFVSILLGEMSVAVGKISFTPMRIGRTMSTAESHSISTRSIDIRLSIFHQIIGIIGYVSYLFFFSLETNHLFNDHLIELVPLISSRIRRNRNFVQSSKTKWRSIKKLIEIVEMVINLFYLCKCD